MPVRLFGIKSVNVYYETGVDHGVLYIPDVTTGVYAKVLLGMVLPLLRNRLQVLNQRLSMQTTSSI